MLIQHSLNHENCLSHNFSGYGSALPNKCLFYHTETINKSVCLVGNGQDGKTRMDSNLKSSGRFFQDFA